MLSLDNRSFIIGRGSDCSLIYRFWICPKMARRAAFFRVSNKEGAGMKWTRTAEPCVESIWAINELCLEKVGNICRLDTRQAPSSMAFDSVVRVLRVIQQRSLICSSDTTGTYVSSALKQPPPFIATYMQHSLELTIRAIPNVMDNVRCACRLPHTGLTGLDIVLMIALNKVVPFYRMVGTGDHRYPRIMPWVKTNSRAIALLT